MIAKAKVISHGANAIRYSVDKDKAEIVKLIFFQMILLQQRCGQGCSLCKRDLKIN